jgi:hypothetical protein
MKVYSTDSDCKISEPDASDSKSGISDSSSVPKATEVTDWLQVTVSDPGPSTRIPVLTTECKAAV